MAESYTSYQGVLGGKSLHASEMWFFMCAVDAPVPHMASFPGVSMMGTGWLTEWLCVQKGLHCVPTHRMRAASTVCCGTLDDE